MNALSRLVLVSLCSLPLLAQEPARQEPGKTPASKPADASAAAPKTLALGMRVNRDVTLTDLDGKQVKAGDLRNKITVVNFFSIDCPIQGKWNSRLASIQKEFEAQDVIFLHIDSNKSEIDATEKPKTLTKDENLQRIRDFLKTNNLPFRVLVDNGNKVADMFDAKTTPHVFVFGKDGKLVYKGLVDDNTDESKVTNHHLKDVLGALVKGDAVEPATTKEQGCTIKRVAVAAPAKEPAAAPAEPKGEPKK